MQIGLWGAGNFGRKLAMLERKNAEGISIVCLIDNDMEKQGTHINGVPVVSVKNFTQNYQESVDGVIVSVLAETAYASIVAQLREIGIQKIGFLKSEGINDFHEIDWIDISKPFLAHVEMHIMDSCNLKCKGCTHFSNLYGDDESYNLDVFSKDLRSLTKQAYVLRLWLLGGEPFLNHNIVEYLHVARELLPQTEIKLVSNGLLIPKQPLTVLEAIKRYNITVDISGYPPTLIIKDKIIDCLRAHGISYKFRQPIKQFFALLGMDPTSDPSISQAKCCDSVCHLLRMGKLYKCPLAGLLYKYKEQFHVDELPDGEGVDINATDFSLQIQQMETSVELCRYCVEKPRYFDWTVANFPTKQDWLGLV